MARLLTTTSAGNKLNNFIFSMTRVIGVYGYSSKYHRRGTQEGKG